MLSANGEIVMFVQEGLGNQLFQYAFARAYSLRHARLLKLDLRHFTDSRNRPFQLDLFDITFEPFGAVDRARLALNNSPKLERFRPIVEIACGKQLFTIVKDKQDGFDPSAMETRGRRLYCYGFWQCERYFSDQAATLRKELTFRSPPSEQNRQTLAEMDRVTAVALHVRRGDYIAGCLEFGALLGESGERYYRQAVEAIRSRVRSPHFFIFSDDPEWVRENMEFAQPQTIISHNTGSASAEDLRLMSHCRHFIVANSSFSWWGAWLAPAAEKFVIAPKNWFADGRGAGRDIVPESWVRL